jgi:hypothetical protein
VTGFVGDASFSPVLLELQVTHVQNTAEQHVTFPGAGSAHDWDNLSAIFPELLRSQKNIAEFSERNRLCGIAWVHDYGNAGVAGGEKSRVERQGKNPSRDRKCLCAE